MTVRSTVASLVVLAVVAGCGGGDDVPTPDELLGRAVTAADLGPGWAASTDSLPQVVGADDRDDLATLDLCPDATSEAVATAAGLRWQVASAAGFVGAEAATPPALVTVLLADEADTIRTVFDQLRQAMVSCLPTEVTLTDAGDVAVSELSVPPVGDDRFGVRWQQIDQPEGSDRWDRRDVLVRDGPILMWLSEIEIDTDADLVVDPTEFDEVVRTAAARLGGDRPAATTVAPGDAGLANPASVFCVEQGGTVEIVDEPDGQVGYCLLPDGRRVEEWEFFRSSVTTTQP